MHRNITLAAPGTVLKLPNQLTTGGIDVIAARGPHCGNIAGIIQYVLKTLGGITTGATEIALRKRIEGDQVDLARHVMEQLRQLPCVLGLIVHPLNQSIFDGRTAPV